MEMLWILLAAGALAYLARALTGKAVRLLAPDPLADFLDITPEADWTTRLGEKLADHLPISRAAMENQIAWARRGDHQETLGRLIFMSLILGIIGMLVALRSSYGAAYLLPVVLAYMPYRSMKKKAERVQNSTVRSLPEAAALIAAELQAAVPVEEALERISALPGPLAFLVRDAMALSQKTGRPLLSHQKGVPGVLRDVLIETGLPALRAFGVQLDMVARIGIGGGDRMQEISRALASEYRQRLREAVARLDVSLSVAVSLCFFVPLIAVIVAGAFSSFLAAF